MTRDVVCVFLFDVIDVHMWAMARPGCIPHILSAMGAVRSTHPLPFLDAPPGAVVYISPPRRNGVFQVTFADCFVGMALLMTIRLDV